MNFTEEYGDFIGGGLDSASSWISSWYGKPKIRPAVELTENLLSAEERIGTMPEGPRMFSNPDAEADEEELAGSGNLWNAEDFEEDAQGIELQPMGQSIPEPANEGEMSRVQVNWSTEEEAGARRASGNSEPHPRTERPNQSHFSEVGRSGGPRKSLSGRC